MDTSVVLAGTLSTHPLHTQALPWLSKAKARDFEFFLSAHTLAETFAVLTRLPTQPPVTPVIAHQLIRENLISCATIVALTGADYIAVLDELAMTGFTGGITYDAIIVKAAKLAQVDYLLTSNVKHFQKLWPEHVDRVIAPDSDAQRLTEWVGRER